ncbi:uncharacterized protein [Mytilus edulis]|uniref:uncharacterized protein n=1 Tax=Mytilus edulis TaxID=6550 RepID=UPI0039F01F17
MTWESLYQTDGPSCPNLFLLVDYMLTLPGSSVDAERGFSCMKLVKSDWRSRLGEDNLSDLMLISMEVDPIATYNPMPAIEKWYTGGLRARRPFYKDDLVKSARVPAETIVIEEGEVIQVNAVSEVVEQPEVVIEDFAYSYDYDSDMSEEEDEEDELFYKTNDMITLQQKSFKLLQEMLSC